MHRKNRMLLGTAALALAAAAFATPSLAAQTIPPASSYADLFTPVPDAAAKLNAADAFERSQGVHMMDAQYWSGYGRPAYQDHHHHHHHHSARWYYNHGYYWTGRDWAPRPVYHDHHHHHHHHHAQYDRYRGW